MSGNLPKRISAIEAAQPNVIGTPPNAKFGRVIGITMIILGFSPMLFGGQVGYIPLTAGALLIILAQLAPSLLGPLNRAWAKLGEILHSFISPLVLGLVFILTVVPTGIFMRLSGKDPLRLKRSNDQDSYWIVREPTGPSSESMKQQF